MKKRISVAAIFILTAALVAGRADAADAPRTEGACSADLTPGTATTILNEGQGPDVILIPGLSTPRAVWEATAARLKTEYRLHIVQIRGFGDDAGPNAAGPVLPVAAQDVRGFIEDCIVGQDRPAPAIIGHSMGGLTGLMVAAEAPDRVGKLMIVDAVPYVATIFFPDATVASMKMRAGEMAGFIRAGHGKSWHTGPVTDPGENSPLGRMSNNAAGRIQVAGWTRQSDMRVAAQLFYDGMTTDMRPALPKVSAPVTLLYAQDDSAMPAERATATFEPQYAGTPHFKAQMVTGSRHFIMLDQPEVFAKAVDDFLAE